VPEIHQLIPRAFGGESITNDALGIQAQLRARRSPGSQIWCFSPLDDPIGVDMAVFPLLPNGSPEDTVIVHLREADGPILSWLEARPERILVRLHGWRPSRMRSIVDAPANTAGSTHEHRLQQLANRALGALPVSPFANHWLRHPRTWVVPPFFPYDEFVRIGASRSDDAGVPRGRGVADRAKTALVVGRIEPHAGVHLAIAATHLAASVGGVDLRLVIAGRTTTPAYERALREFARDLRIRVTFAGDVPQDYLYNLAAQSSVLLLPSESSGFGVRGVEAMAAGLPVIARRAGALADTLGDAALLLDEDDGPSIWAEAMLAVLGDAELRARLQSRGRERAAALAPAHSAGVLDVALRELFDDSPAPSGES
jgi:glycosyltransferase involved in cell wall biosynthesis